MSGIFREAREIYHTNEHYPEGERHNFGLGREIVREFDKRRGKVRKTSGAAEKRTCRGKKRAYEFSVRFKIWRKWNIHNHVFISVWCKKELVCVCYLRLERGRANRRICSWLQSATSPLDATESFTLHLKTLLMPSQTRTKTYDHCPLIH